MHPERAGSDIHARMFAPGLNVAEDPATGSAYLDKPGTLEQEKSWVVDFAVPVPLKPGSYLLEAYLTTSAPASQSYRARVPLTVD